MPTATNVQQQRMTMVPPGPTLGFGWRQAMSPAEEARFETTIAGPLLNDLGYEMRTRGAASSCRTPHSGVGA
jgi:hypothetical protein